MKQNKATSAPPPEVTERNGRRSGPPPPPGAFRPQGVTSALTEVNFRSEYSTVESPLAGEDTRPWRGGRARGRRRRWLGAPFYILKLPFPPGEGRAGETCLFRLLVHKELFSAAGKCEARPGRVPSPVTVRIVNPPRFCSLTRTPTLQDYVLMWKQIIIYKRCL